jgi:hypothetical protein
MAGPSRRVLLAIALISATTLAFQVVLTRLFSSVVAYHFSFLAISLALLGAGAGGLVIYVAPQRFERPSTEAVLARWAAIYAVALVVCPIVFIRLDLGGGRDANLSFDLKLGAVSLVAAGVSFTAGVVIAVAIRAYASRISTVYACDLIGAGLGALLVVPLLFIPAPFLLACLGLLSGAASLLFAAPSADASKARVVMLGVVVAIIVTNPLSSALELHAYSGHDLVSDQWTPLARVLAYDNGPNAPYSVVLYDKIVAPVPTVHGNEIPNWKTMSLGAQSVPYALTGKPGRTLVIGGGGGRDIWNALSSGQKVDVIELNSAIRDAVDKTLGNVSGHPYTRPGVSTTIGDGRSVLARRSTKYDHINIGFTDTLTASAAQGFALTENNLYTVEAFKEYFDHLAPGGILAVSRLQHLVGEESLRATVLTLGALQDYGIKNPERNVVVVAGRDGFGGAYGTVLARLTPFTNDEVAKLTQLANERGNGILYAPGGPDAHPWDELAKQGWSTFCHGYHLDVCPPTDNRPFFFNMRRPSQIGQRESGNYLSVDPYDILVLTFGILLVLSVIGLVVPMMLVRGARRPPLSTLVYFVAIGLGFLMLEIVLVQRFVLFLGFPTYALSIVLFSLLLFTGVGARLSAYLLGNRRRAVTALAVMTAVIASTALWLQPLLESLIDIPFAGRVVLSVVITAPIGILLGLPMPIGLDRLRRLHEQGIPYAWGVNGVASVVASVFGVLAAILLGFNAVALLAAACYAIALLHAAIGRWAPA